MEGFISSKKVAVVFMLFFYTQAGFAQAVKCKKVADESVRRCQAVFDKAEQSAGQAMQQVGDGDYGGRDINVQMSGAAKRGAEAFALVEGPCMQEKRKCADTCNSVQGPEAAYAKKVKTDCFAAVERTIASAHVKQIRGQQIQNQTAEAADQMADVDQPKVEKVNFTECTARFYPDGSLAGPWVGSMGLHSWDSRQICEELNMAAYLRAKHGTK